MDILVQVVLGPQPRSRSGHLDSTPQATVLQPEQTFALKELITRLDTEVSIEVTDPWKRVAAAGMQAIALGWMRYKHLQRSRPIERDDVVVWFRCSSGKTPSQEQSFEWCLPRSYGSRPPQTSSGTPGMPALLWRKRSRRLFRRASSRTQLQAPPLSSSSSTSSSKKICGSLCCAQTRKPASL